MHVAVRFPGMLFDARLLGRLEERGVKLYPVSLHTIHPRNWADCLVIGYGHLDTDRIRKGTELLVDELR